MQYTTVLVDGKLASVRDSIYVIYSGHSPPGSDLVWVGPATTKRFSPEPAYVKQLDTRTIRSIELLQGDSARRVDPCPAVGVILVEFEPGRPWWKFWGRSKR
jgi:hypothetical protein